MIYDGRKVSTTPGTRVRLSATPAKFAWLTVQPCFAADGTPANMGPVVIGGKTVSMQSGFVLQVGDSGVAWPIADIEWGDLQEIWMDVVNSGDGVQFMYVQR